MDIVIRVKEVDGMFLIKCDGEPGVNLCGCDLQKLLFDFYPVYARVRSLNEHQQP